MKNSLVTVAAISTLLVCGTAPADDYDFYARTRYPEGGRLLPGVDLYRPVQTGTGVSTIGELAKHRLTERFPGLAGTDLVEDTAAPITALLTSDRKYFLTELQIVESGTIAPEPAEAPAILLQQNLRVDHFTLTIDSAEAFATARDNLIRLGASTGEVQDFRGADLLAYTDPDGHIMEVIHTPADAAAS